MEFSFVSNHQIYVIDLLSGRMKPVSLSNLFINTGFDLPTGQRIHIAITCDRFHQRRNVMLKLAVWHRIIFFVNSFYQLLNEVFASISVSYTHLTLPTN